MEKISKRQIIDTSLKSITYLASLIAVLILGAILFFVFSNGSSLLSWKVITSDYNAVTYNLKTTSSAENNNFTNPNISNTYFSKLYGVSIKDDLTLEGLPTIRFVYIDDNSPFNYMTDSQGNEKNIEVGFIFDSTIRITTSENTSKTIFSKDGAKNLSLMLDEAFHITSANVKFEGGGIRGSIITTLYLIVLTLLIGLPFGVLTALYLHEIAPQNRLTNILRSFIDMLTGVPSIIFGLMGAAVFIPFTGTIFNNPDMRRGSLISGALTLSVIILPVVIKATEAALDVVPKAYKEGSLALGATKTQTTFKIMLPNALPGILSAAILSIGRVIGESAALIFAMGTFIGDNVSLTGRSTSLAVHIWSAMGGEIPNIKLASTIAIIILIVVLTLNLVVKLITYRFMKKYK